MKCVSHQRADFQLQSANHLRWFCREDFLEEIDKPSVAQASWFNLSCRLLTSFYRASAAASLLIFSKFPLAKPGTG